MKQKLFTILTLLLCLCSGAWADQIEINTNNGSTKTGTWTANSGSVTGSVTITGVGNISFSMPKVDDSNAVGSSYVTWKKKTVLTITMPEGYVISAAEFTFSSQDKGPANSGKNDGDINKNMTCSLGTLSEVGETHTVVSASGTPSNSITAKNTMGAEFRLSKITLTYSAGGAQAPVFTPASGSAVAEGSKIEITSLNATSIKYKWTNSTDTPTDGWSVYDADAKVIVPAESDGTPYLHAQGFKGEDAGTAGYAQYTITAPDTDAPSLDTTSPANDEVNVAVAGNIVLTFDEDVVCTTNATLTPAGGEAVELTPTVSGTTVTYAYTGLAYNKVHTFNLAANSVADGSGNKYASAINFSFTTIQETCATPTFKVYGNKVVEIACATEGATIYYGGSDVKTGEKTEYTGKFIPTANGTIYAYATKAGAIESGVASQAVTLPVVGDVVGDLMMTLLPGGSPSSDTDYEKVGDYYTFTKSNYSLASDKVFCNSFMAGYPCNFKASVNTATFTITPPSDVTIKSIKICGTSNDNSKTTEVTAGDGGTIISTYSKLMSRNVFVGTNTNVEMSEVIMTVNSPSAGSGVTFKLGGSASQCRFYVEIYGTTSATTEPITPAKTYTTYVPTHNLDFTSTNKLTAFIATSATASTVTMTSVDKVPAGTPIVVKATETGSAINVNVTTTTDDVSANLLKAGDGTTSIGGTSKYDYLLSDGKFYRAEEGTIAVGKAYLHLDAAPAAGSRELSIVFEGETTGISNVDVNTNDNFDANAPMYNLAGQRVTKSYKGVVIVNGKKMLNK